MLKRTITGAIIFLFTFAFVFLKQFSPLIFDAYVLIVSYFSIYEVTKAYKSANKKTHIWLLYLVPAVFCVIFNLEKDLTTAFIYELLMVVSILVIGLSADIIEFAKNRKENETKEPEELNKTLFDKTKYSLMVFAYPLLPLSFLLILNHMEYTIGYVGIVMAFAVSMLTDTCAYFFGVAFGKKKFVPEVSPKKSIEGMIGGFFGGIVGAGACFSVFYFTDILNISQIAPLWVLILAFALVGVVGSYINQLGDLIASALKRKVGIKDYAHIFPGHGGFMDRVDGLMFTAVFIMIIFSLLLV